MEYIYVIDLTAGTIEKTPYDIREEKEYGRGLAHRLLREYTLPGAGRYSSGNALVFVPGLFAGCAAPSCARMTILAKSSESGVQVCNVSGNMPQKMGSLGICGLVIKGADAAGNAVLHLSAAGAALVHIPETAGKETGEVVRYLKECFGREAAIVGTGITGDMRLPLSSLFCTYPDGEPEYHCPRGSFGDIPGSKGLRAVVVTGRDYFARRCADPAAFRLASKKLTAEIMGNEICSGALPSYGSMTLIRLLRDGLLPVPSRSAASSAEVPTSGSNKRINYCCAPMCVIGCLNRHSRNSGELYDSPDQSELATALKDCFGIEDTAFLKVLQHRLRALCLTSIEFVTAARCYFVTTGTEPDEAQILALLDEISNGTDTGRLVGSRAEGISTAFPGNPALLPLVDRPAIAEEGSVAVRLARRGGRFAEVSDLDYLYYQIFVFENLGVCLFASFALVNNDGALATLADLFEAMTGLRAVGEDDLVLYAKRCVFNELAYEKANGARDARVNLPSFTKVLYQYFAQSESEGEGKT